MGEDVKLPRRVRQALYDWSRRYSGYDKHMAELHPPIGYLDWGDVRFTIKTITFEHGQMKVVAEAGTTEAGQVHGLVKMFDTSGNEMMSGQREADMGIKTSGSTWTFTWHVRVPWSMADDTPPAPQPA